MKSSTTVSSGMEASMPQTALVSFSQRVGSLAISSTASLITRIISLIRGQCCGMMDKCRHSGLDCISAVYPLFFILSPSLQLFSRLHRKVTMVECGIAIIYSSLWDWMKLTSLLTPSSNALVVSRKPYQPRSRKEPHAALRAPPFLDPRAVGEMQIPPGQVEKVKYWFLLILEFRQTSTDDPLGAYPYLWMSALMLVTAGTRKSHFPNLCCPSFSMNGSTKPPIAESICRGTPYFSHTLPIYSISSTTP